MKKTNRILSILLVVIMVASMLPMSAFAADTTKYWVSVTASPFDGSGGTISGEGEYAPGEQVTISIAPNTDGGYCAAQWGLVDIGEGIISAIEQKTSHTFTMPENTVQISITFTQHSYITYSDLGDGTHQNKCFYCMTPNGEPEAHVDAHGGGDGTTPPDGYCDSCSAELHTHSYSSEWSSDEEGHYHECSCGATSDFAEHTSSGAATEDNAEVCTVCGYEISPKLTHTHSYGTLKYDADNHWYECSCGDETAVTAHSYEYECTAKCSDCDYERLATHVYDGEDCGDGEQHLLRCRYCGVQYRTDNLTSVFPHEYDDDCDSVCDICGYERTDAHNYEWIKDADGHEEKCSVCGNVMVTKTAHTSGGAATDDTPETCSVCGYEIAPKLKSTLTIVYNDTNIGGELAYHPGRAIYKFPTGTVVDLSDYWPEKREYTVDGEKYFFWNFTPNAGYGNILTSVTLNQDTTVYACWVITGNMNAITFDATGGSVVPKKIVDRNLLLVNDNVPTRHGYEFLGWSLENDGTPDDLMGYRLTSDCTLYATWKQVHNISSNWSYDEEVHYRTCDCGERHDESEHSYYITKKVCYKCGYVQGMAIGSTDKTSVEFVPVTGTTLPEGSYLDVKAYEVVEKDVETIFKATVTDGVSGVTEIIPETKGTISDDGWVFSEQYTLRMGDKVTIGGVTYIVISYEGGKACLISGGEEYYLDKDTGLYKTGYRYDSYSTDTELISIDGVQYVIVCRITSGDFETVYFTTTEGKAAGHYLVDKGETSDARFYSDCTPEALTPKVSVGGVVAIADGQFLVNTASGVKIANTVWANDISFHGATGLPVTGVSGTLTVSGIQYATTKSTVAAHIGAQGVDVGRFDDSVFDIRDVDDFSPFVLLDVADFSGTVIELTGVTQHTHSFEWVIDKEATETEDGIKHEECACGVKQNENTVIPKTGTDNLVPEPEVPNGLSTGAIVAIVIACVVVLAGGGFALYRFVCRKKKQF